MDQFQLVSCKFSQSQFLWLIIECYERMDQINWGDFDLPHFSMVFRTNSADGSLRSCKGERERERDNSLIRNHLMQIALETAVIRFYLPWDRTPIQFWRIIESKMWWCWSDEQVRPLCNPMGKRGGSCASLHPLQRLTPQYFQLDWSFYRMDVCPT